MNAANHLHRGHNVARLTRWVSLQAYGALARCFFRAGSSPLAMRARFERFASFGREALRRRFPQLRFEDHRLGRLCLESVCAVGEPDCVIIHLHGGAFVFGSAASYRRRAQRLSYRSNAEVFVPDYRLAPEHPFPAALQDALLTFQYVRAIRPHAPIFISGDSAGGGLALSVLLRLRDLGERMPQGAIMLSPWTDLSVSGASVDTNRHNDVWLSRAHLERWASYYAPDCDVRTPLLSPLFARLHALPPLLLLAGEHEVLLDDALRVAESAKRAGTSAQLHVGRGMQHDWPLTLPWLAESRAAWQVICEFIRSGCTTHTCDSVPSPSLPATILQHSHLISNHEEFVP